MEMEVQMTEPRTLVVVRPLKGNCLDWVPQMACLDLEKWGDKKGRVPNLGAFDPFLEAASYWNCKVGCSLVLGSFDSLGSLGLEEEGLEFERKLELGDNLMGCYIEGR